MLPFRIARANLAENGDLRTLPAFERALAVELEGPRLTEFCAGRAAARAALADLLGAPAESFAIGRAEDGAPIGPNGVIVSISHGRTGAVAVAGRGLSLLGVDLCDLAQAERVERVTARFCDPDERALAVASGSDVAWATYWALKEAAAKALRAALLDGGLRASRLRTLEPPAFDSPAVQALVQVGPENVVAVVWS
jgi:4'-phosphopantetheinyl transferase EntD